MNSFIYILQCYYQNFKSTLRRGDHKFLFSENVGYCKWFHNQSVIIRFGNVEGMATKPKGLASKILVPCPDVIQKYNQEFGGVDLVNQRTAAYNLDRKSFIRFYQHIFCDLVVVACTNSVIVYQIIRPKWACSIWLQNCRFHLIGWSLHNQK